MRRSIGVAAGLFLLAVALVWPARASANESIPLAGEWRFALDLGDAGTREQWFEGGLAGRIRLPGVLESQGFGDEISAATPWVLSLYDRFWFLREDYKAYARPGGVKVPFLSQPPRHYVGPAWYQRDVQIPEGWRGRRVVLFMERPRWESTVWVDSRRVGSNHSLVASHTYDLGALAPGRHRLTVRVDSSMLLPYRPDAHSVSDSLGGSWNGIVGRIELTSTSQVWIEDAQVYPDVSKKAALVKVAVGNATGRAGSGTLSAGGVSIPVAWDAQGGSARLDVPLGRDAKLWDEFSPALQKLTLRLTGEGIDESRELSFGLVEFKTEGRDFVVNGRKTYLRGNHHGGDFPLTGYPPTDVEYWRRVIRVQRDWGINHIRFHSFCPPEAAFTAADELGVYLQPEPGMWNEISPNTPMERMLYEETERMIRAYGNHPSFVMLSAGNEPKGRWKQSLPRWAEHFRREDPRRLYTTGTGHTDREIPDPEEGADYLVIQRLGEKMLRGPSAWFGRDYRDSLAGLRRPVVSHELGQWAAYPDYSVTKKFKGYMRPGNYEIFRDSLAAHGLLGKNEEFARASGRFQLACYKEEIEANLRTPGLAGFQLLELHDYVGQGTAIVGLLDPFWESKGYATAAEFRRFNSETVPLARLPKRVFTTADQFEVEVEVAHYGPADAFAKEVELPEHGEGPLTGALPAWKIVDAGGKLVAKGIWPARAIPPGKTPLGKITADLSRLKAPGAYKLVVGLYGGSSFENDWNFWLYPPRVDDSAPRGVLVTRSWDEAEARLAAGGKVLYLPRRADLDWTSPPLDTVPVFWNRLMGPAWGRMLGLLADVRHPALSGFPTEANFDWQWSDVMRGARAVNLDRLPRTLEPIVWAIDDWNRNYKLGLVFECMVGRGRLVVSGADLATGLDTRPAARQLRRSLLDYMTSPRFRPAVAVQPEELRALHFDTRIMRKLNTVTVADWNSPNPVSNAFDGDPNTFWLAGDAKKGLKHPHQLSVFFIKDVPVSGLVLMPRQNHREHEGDIRGYIVETSDDGEHWREVARGELVSTFEPQRVTFPRTLNVRYLRLTALNGFGSDATAALAELAIVYAGPKLPPEPDDAPEYKRSRTATTDIEEAAPAPQPSAPAPRGERPGRVSAAQSASPRERVSFNAGWRFQKDDPPGAEGRLSYEKIKSRVTETGGEFVAAGATSTAARPDDGLGADVAYTRRDFDDSGWRRLDLPHDWGVEGPFRQEYPGETGKLAWWGVGWYRKHFDVPAADRGKRLYLDIDGAMSYATVWLNGRFVGGWPYGYASFRLDLTPFIVYGAENVLAVRLDNPPDSSRWYPGGGIYRNVWLVKTAPVHVAHWGTYVTTPDVSTRAASVNVRVTLDNDSATAADVTVRTRVYELASDGSKAAKPSVISEPSRVSLAARSSASSVSSVRVVGPKLWSTRRPSLYAAVTTVEQGGKTVDVYETVFGIRTIKFDAARGLLLNGDPVEIKGVCNHHDLGALGAALNVRALERQLEILKEMGANAVRTSHNPPAPELLELADRMGFLVMDEAFDAWRRAKKKNDYHLLFDDWHERDVRALVRRDRNHPSVMLWSTGNEIGEQRGAAGHKISEELARIVREEDPTRPVTAGANYTEAGYNGFQQTVDVFGFNYKPEEYGKFREKNPSIPLYASETASTVSSRGEYFFPVVEDKLQGRADFQVSSYDLYAPPWATPPDREFKGQDEFPFTAGEFVWTGFDYLGEPTPYNDDVTNLLNFSDPTERARMEAELKALGKIRVPSRSSYFGIVDLAGFKKDRFYIYQARWRPELPMAHILPHWNWPGRERQVTPVHVYTSGDEAELFLNGRTLGRKRRGAFEYRLRWDDVKYEPGELRVVAYRNGKRWAEEVLKTTGPASRLTLKADHHVIRADGSDLSFVTVSITDSAGLVVPRSKNRIRFEVNGPGEIVAVDNGDATGFESFKSKERAAYNGLCLVVVRSKAGTPGRVKLRAYSEGLKSGDVTITTARARP